MKTLIALFGLVCTTCAFGQTVALRGNVPASVRTATDIGRADPSQILRHITIHFKPAPAQQADLDTLLAEQQNPSSAYYHVWLTPERFGERFGLSSSDFESVVAWLKNAGFQVNTRAAARNWVAVDGSVATVESAFHTEIHNYRAKGETHFANSTEPSVPAAIAPLVSAITELTDFRVMAPARHMHSAVELPKGTTASGVHYLSPDDLAVIYDIGALYSLGYDGSGQTVVIPGGSDIDVGDITEFRTLFGLPSINLQQILVPGTKDPGFVPDSEGEADLDIEWSGAVARNATIVYVYAPSNVAAFDYAVSPPAGIALPGQIVSASFGSCEAQAGPAVLQEFQSEVNQANAEGVTVMNSSGDSGPAACDPTDQSAEAKLGESVQIPSSIPGVTAVGGTEFNEGSGAYWSAANTAGYLSVLSYIPEAGWNNSGAGGLAASGGGYSTYFAKPAWQNVPGVPAGSFRVVPDVAMAASATHDYYILVSADSCAGGVCPDGGTSAASPVFAGIVALLNQYGEAQGLSGGGMGNINPALYALYTSTPNAFHDITEGNNIVSCVIGSLDCSSGSYGYIAGPGYDMVTGLGSVDAANLITQWFGKSVTSTGPPLINNAGVVPVFSKATTIQPGEWASIYGLNLAAGIVSWNGNFPTSLGNTTVTIDGKFAYLWYVSPRQINFQVPNDATTGPVAVVVTTPGGSASTTVTLGPFAPSFSLLDSTHVAGIIIRSDGSGAYDNGLYDIIGPTGTSLGYPTVAAKAGDSVELFGVGFGPTNPVVPAGQAFSSSASTLPQNPVQILIDGLSVNPSFTGISGDAGLYQLNFTLPVGFGKGDVSLVATVGGLSTPSGVVISLQ
jgi:uncharacterized protein (TIGR03437 family)